VSTRRSVAVLRTVSTMGSRRCAGMRVVTPQLSHAPRRRLLLLASGARAWRHVGRFELEFEPRGDMLKAVALSCALGALLLACSSSTTVTCGTISGSYSETETLGTLSGTDCMVPVAATAGPIGITITGPGPDHEVTLPQLQGSCPAKSSGCSLSVDCNFHLTDSAGNPVGSGTLAADWTFSTTGFTGQSTMVFPKSDGSRCTWTLADTGTKK
jgi:hypothetical protein